MSDNQRLMDEMVRFVEYAFPEQGYQINPMWLIEAKDGTVQPVTTQFDGPESKAAAAKEVAKIMNDMDAVRYGFMAEAWSIALDKDHPDFDRADNVDVREHRDRREVVYLMVEDKDGGYLSGAFYILRPEKGTAKLSPFKTDPSSRVGNVGGRLSGLLREE